MIGQQLARMEATHTWTEQVVRIDMGYDKRDLELGRQAQRVQGGKIGGKTRHCEDFIPGLRGRSSATNQDAGTKG